MSATYQVEKHGDHYGIRFGYVTKEGKRRNISLTKSEWKWAVLKKSEFRVIALEAMAKRIKELQEEEAQVTRQSNTLEYYINKFVEYDETMSRSTTTESKQRRLRLYLGAYFGMDKEVREIFDTKSMSDFRLYMSRQPLSYQTKNHILTTTKQFIDYLISQKAIDGAEGYAMKSSLISLKDTNENESEGETEAVGDNFWTKEQYDTFMQSFEKDDPYRFFFYISFWCATRIGETLALKFSDFDERSGLLHINRARNNHAKVGATKTKYSKASISVPSHVFKNLKEYKNLVQGNDDDFLFFPTIHGARTTIRRKLDQHIEMCHLKKITPHGFRHSMASYLLAQGFDYMDVCKYLRHSSPDITLKVYSHWIQKKNQKQFSEMDE